MGLYYQLENNDLDVCFACGLVSEGGEAGCVAYTTDGLKTLRTRAHKKEQLDLFFMAYQLQHYTYFALNPTEAMLMLQAIGYYVQYGRYLPANNTKRQSEVVDFALQPVTSPIFMVQILQAPTKKESNALIRQYLSDVWEAYAVYHPHLASDSSE